MSNVMESLAVFDTFPAASLYQTYIVLAPLPLLKVYTTLALKLVADDTAVQPEADADGLAELVER